MIIIIFDLSLNSWIANSQELLCFQRSRQGRAHAANVSPIKKITIKWKCANKTIAMSTGQKFIHFKIKVNILKEQCKSNALLVEKTNDS